MLRALIFHALGCWFQYDARVSFSTMDTVIARAPRWNNTGLQPRASQSIYCTSCEQFTHTSRNETAKCLVDPHSKYADSCGWHYCAYLLSSGLMVMDRVYNGCIPVRAFLGILSHWFSRERTLVLWKSSLCAIIIYCGDIQYMWRGQWRYAIYVERTNIKHFIKALKHVIIFYNLQIIIIIFFKYVYFYAYCLTSRYIPKHFSFIL